GPGRDYLPTKSVLYCVVNSCSVVFTGKKWRNKCRRLMILRKKPLREVRTRCKTRPPLTIRFHRCDMRLQVLASIMTLKELFVASNEEIWLFLLFNVLISGNLRRHLDSLNPFYLGCQYLASF